MCLPFISVTIYAFEPYYEMDDMDHQNTNIYIFVTVMPNIQFSGSVRPTTTPTQFGFEKVFLKYIPALQIHITPKPGDFLEQI